MITPSILLTLAIVCQNPLESQALELPTTPVDSFSVKVVFDQIFDSELILDKYSVRSNSFAVWEQGTDGSLQRFAAPDISTYRGVVAGVPGSRVAASLLEDGLYAIVKMGDGSGARIIQPLSSLTKSSNSSLHAVFSEGDIPVDTVHLMKEPLLWPGYGQSGMAASSANGGGSNAPRASETIEIGIDCDFQYYNLFGKRTSRVVQYVESMLNVIDEIYSNDVGLCYDINDIVIRTTANDPYTTRDTNTVLYQLRSEWQGPLSHLRHDMAALFSGRDFTATAIGQGFQGSICTSYKYSVSAAKYSRHWSRRISLVAHEFGHNWDAAHCCGTCSCSGCNIMCPCNEGCSTNKTMFSAQSISSILSHKNSRICLSSGCSTIPPTDPFKLIPPMPPIAGQNNTISVVDGTAGGSASIYFSMVQGPTATTCTGMYLGLINPRTLGVITLDSSGAGSFSAAVPPTASGLTVYLQALDSSGCMISNMEALVVQ